MKIRKILSMVLLLGMLLSEGAVFGAPYLKQRLQPEVIWGRFCLTIPKERSGAVNVTRKGTFPLHFQLTAGNGRLANVEYRYAGRQEFILISCQNGFSLLKFRADLEKNTYVLLLQGRDGKELHLEMGTVSERMIACMSRELDEKIQTEELHGKNVRSWQAESFWDLLFSCPEECRKPLNEIVSICSEDGELLKKFSRNFASVLIQQEMESRVREKDPTVFGSRIDSKKMDTQIRELLQQLDSEEFSFRRRADAELRQYGLGIFLYLGRIPQENLSPEVRFRLTRILEQAEKSMDLSRENCLYDVQFWVDRPAAWVGVLEFGTPEQQDQAWKHLIQNRSRFFPASQNTDLFAEEIQSTAFSALPNETQLSIIQSSKDLIFSTHP